MKLSKQEEVVGDTNGSSASESPAQLSTQSPTSPTPMPKFEIMTITPELAKEWLESNTRNREIKWRRVKEFSSGIKRGEWMLNGATILFDKNGTLIDGQHRLLAVVDAGQSVLSLVGFGLSSEIQLTVDTGTKRSLADALKLLGEVDANHLGTITRYAFLYERYITSSTPVDGRIDTPSITQLLAYFSSHRARLAPALLGGGTAARHLGAGNKSMLAVAWSIFHEIDWEDCEDFFWKLGKGVDKNGNGINADDPIYALRRWLKNNYIRREKARVEVVLAIIIKAWNAYRDGISPGNLRWAGGGASPEAFPKAK